MIRRTREAQKRFHGKEGDLIDYKITVKYYLFGFLVKTLEDDEVCEDVLENKKGMGFK